MIRQTPSQAGMVASGNDDVMVKEQKPGQSLKKQTCKKTTYKKVKKQPLTL
jgi:hypothetical protein